MTNDPPNKNIRDWLGPALFTVVLVLILIFFSGGSYVPDLERRSVIMSFRTKLLSFVVALIVCGTSFLLLDIALMNAQGLSLFFQG